jgi:4-aminobutyrate aminotransferase-like enzyme
VFTPASKRGPYVRYVPVIDPFRQRNGRSDEQLADFYIEQLQHAIDDFERNGVKLAAVLFCTAFSSEGLPDIPNTYFPKVAAAVHAAGGLVIADEVQAGFGRFGSHMWGHDRHGMVPDIVTMGKPMGNGHPLAGVVTTAALMEDFTSQNMYFNTFGGNEVSAAVGHAMLNVLRDEKLLENALTVGEYVLTGMRRLQQKYRIIGDVRGQGMFFAVEIVSKGQPDAATTKRIVNTMRERGVLISRIGLHDNILKIRPPMVFTRENADVLLSTLDSVLS